MLAAKIFQSDDLIDLEIEIQAYLNNIDNDPQNPPQGFDWGAHDVAVQFDGKNALSRQSYSALIVITPNS